MRLFHPRISGYEDCMHMGSLKRMVTDMQLKQRHLQCTIACTIVRRSKNRRISQDEEGHMNIRHGKIAARALRRGTYSYEFDRQTLAGRLNRYDIYVPHLKYQK